MVTPAHRLSIPEGIVQSSIDAANSRPATAFRILVAIALALAAIVPAMHGGARAQGRQAVQPRFSVDSSIATLADDPRAKAIVDKYMPGMTSGPHYLMAAAFSPRQIKARMSGSLSDAKFNQMQKELTQLR
jgi:hypothetical protein